MLARNFKEFAAGKFGGALRHRDPTDLTPENVTSLETLAEKLDRTQACYSGRPLEASSAIPSIELRFKIQLLPSLRESTHASES